MARGDELIRILLAEGDEEDVGLGYELLQEIFRGFPLRKVRHLLHSTEPSAVKAGAWIVSELGADAGPLMIEVTPFSIIR